VKNPDVSDLVNTILKMADKRALVAATLIATGLSEYFTQDMDDFVTAEFVATPAPKSEPAALTYEQAAALTFSVKGVEKPLNTLTSQQLQFIVEKSGNPQQVMAAEIVLEHDFQIQRPS
jgi:hypothetical protein